MEEILQRVVELNLINDNQPSLVIMSTDLKRIFVIKGMCPNKNVHLGCI